MDYIVYNYEKIDMVHSKYNFYGFDIINNRAGLWIYGEYS